MAAGESEILSLLNSEFEKWNDEAVEAQIYLLEATEKDDGSATVLFSLVGEYEFMLHCPRGYPNPNNDGVFVVETAGNLRVWANALNEFCLDTEPKPRLHNILYKAMSLYNGSKSHRESVCLSSEDETLEEEEEESEVGVSLTDDDAFTTEKELKIARIKKQWLQKEIQIRAEMKKSETSSPQPMTDESITLDKLTVGKSQTKQIFSTDASSGILTNDLIAIMENEKDNGISAEPIDDNIYNWCVKLSGFQTKSALDEDLRIINERFGYNFIELQLEFTMDLYPFYPPLVKVVRPRLQPAMMQRVTNMELLKYSFWNPARDMMTILCEIKAFLQEWARLDLDTRRNNIQLLPQGAYLEIEHDLLRLAMVSEVCPRANLKFIMQKELLAPLNATAGGKNSKPKEYWAAGTGFGSGCTKRQDWNVNAHVAAQKLKDQQIVAVLHKILYELKQFSNSQCSSISVDERHVTNGICNNDVEIPMEICESNSGEILNNSDSAICMELGNEACSSSSSSLGPSTCCLEEELHEIIEASALIPFLESQLRTSSFLEICRHSMLYNAIIEVIKEMARLWRLVPLLGSLSDQEKSIVDCLHPLKDQASDLILRIGKGAANGSVPHLKPADASLADPTSAEEKIAKEFSTLHEQVVRAIQRHCKNAGSCGSISLDSTNASSQLPEEALYQRCLKHLQFQNHSFATTGSNAHLYSPCLRQRQCAHVRAHLSHRSGALVALLFVATQPLLDEDRCTLLRVMIIGPEDTPYAGGCYLFDIFFPDRYPTVAPMVQFKTTGKGTVRFNPNLYSCGKVCLSLLGTWVGQEGERWNSETSTILQVLVSIQSLILVSEPYFNEPGYESKIGTEHGKKLSDGYNEDVRINNIKWAMVDQLNNPCPGFEDVIRLHFFIKKKRILQDIARWLEESKSARLRQAAESLERELCKLQSRSDLQEKVQMHEDQVAVIQL
uniref:UBC core domain-containing protein n=1 Tax=Strigamia maritima TaxID=126957 RepID=T1IP19_STRMM